MSCIRMYHLSWLFALALAVPAIGQAQEAAPAPQPGDGAVMAAPAPAALPDAPWAAPKGKGGLKFTVLTNTGYTVGYSEDRKDPLWATYSVAKTCTLNSKRPDIAFKTDDRTQAALKDDDFKDPTRTYDRGHMAPSHAIGTCFGPDAQDGTFILSNVCPQAKDLNEQTWEALEETIVDRWAQDFGQVWVYVGPIFKNPKKLKRLNDAAAIPDAFYCLVAHVHQKGAKKTVHVLALRMDQSVSGEQPLKPYVTTVKAVETATGVDFFPGLAKEATVEAAKADADWGANSIVLKKSGK